MKKKIRRKLLISGIAYLFLFMNVNMPVVYGAASGNYTDLLPIGAAANTTVISNGTGWSLTTLPPTQTFGDSLSRVVDVVYQSSGVAIVTNTGVVSTITALSQGNVGSATIPNAWVASGRSIRTTIIGSYTTTSSTTWTWEFLLGTTTIATTGSVAAIGNQTNQWFKATDILTIANTGASGTLNNSYEIMLSSALTPSLMVSISTASQVPTAIDLTTAQTLVVRPRFTWGNPSPANIIRFTNVIIELLN